MASCNMRCCCTQEVEKRLELSPQHSAHSKATLRRFGNTCCAAVFYVLTNVEATVCPAASQLCSVMGCSGMLCIICIMLDHLPHDMLSDAAMRTLLLLGWCLAHVPRHSGLDI